MLRDAVGDVVLQFACAAYDFGIIEHVGEDLPKMAHGHDREHVGRHEVRIDAGVVAGTESGPGHTGDGKRSAEAFVRHGITRVIVRAEEPVPRLGVILFGLEGVKDATHAGDERFVEMRGQSGIAIQQPCELDGVA